MGIMDSELIFEEGWDISGSANDTDTSDNVIYLPAVTDHKGDSMNQGPNVSGRLCWNGVVEDTDLLAAVDGSVITFSLYAHTSATNVTSSGTLIDSVSITANTPTDHPDGTQLFCRPLPMGQIAPYLQVKRAIATQDLSTGGVTIFISPPIQQG